MSTVNTRFNVALATVQRVLNSETSEPWVLWIQRSGSLGIGPVESEIVLTDIVGEISSAKEFGTINSSSWSDESESREFCSVIWELDSL